MNSATRREKQQYSNLFCNNNTIGAIYEYKKECFIIREAIAMLEDVVTEKCPLDKESKEYVHYEFAEAIVENAKAAYDNMAIGHIDIVNMINRKIIEQYISLKIFINNPDKQLENYWRAHSFYKGIDSYLEKYDTRLSKMMNDMYERLNIPEQFYEKTKKANGSLGKAPIEKNYGWIYPITKDNPTFKKLCELAGEPNYEDFSFMSEFVHGTNLLFINRKSLFESTILNTLSILTFVIQQFVILYIGYLDGEKVLMKFSEFEELCMLYLPEDMD